MNGEILQQKITHKGRKNSQPQDLQRQEGSGKCLCSLSEPVQGTTGHHGAKAKGCQRFVYLCGVVLLRTHHGRADNAPTPANDVAGLQNEQVVYVSKESYRNHLREAKHQ